MRKGNVLSPFLSLDNAEISQKVTTGKLLLMVVKEQAHLLFTFLREDLLKVLKQENKHLIASDDARTSKGYTINLTYVCKQVWYPPVIFLLSASLMGNEFFNQYGISFMKIQEAPGQLRLP